MFEVPVELAYTLVNSLTPLVGPVAAIACFVVGIRLLLHPLSRAAVRGETTRTEYMTKVKALQDKHKGNKKKLDKELLELNSTQGTAMFAGCMPLLLQMPFLMIMYRMFTSDVVGGAPNQLLTATVFDVPLGMHWASVSGAQTLVFMGLAALFLLVGHLSARWAARQQTTVADPDQPGAQTMARLVRVLPYGTVLVTAFLPLAACVYVLISTSWTVAERAYLRRGISSSSEPVAAR
ncbi:membrane protein insertase YidC [Pseudonocardiaceae bacterium YIM PH 21723]|nr:membrane protein insertase YidC [Pseudonocardiaceae bacterium YIM PH 21723]